MENLIKHISNPNKKTINLIKLGNGDIVTSPSKWLSDRWFLRESNFAENLTCIEISPFKNNKDSNTFVGKKYLKYKVYNSFDGAPKDIDFLSIIDPDNAFEVLKSIDHSKYKIKYLCVAINPLKNKNFKQNKKDIELLLKDKYKFIKQNRTELFYSVIES